MIVVVPVDPPREGFVLSSLVKETPVSRSEAARLYEAACGDVLRAADASGGDPLVNYRDEETLPEAFAETTGDGEGDVDPEAEARAIAVDALGSTDDLRFERQVGSTRAARVGNTVTHLLEREGATSVGVLDPTAALVARSDIDGAAMSIRRNDVVLGPAPGGRTYFACFSEPIDFTDAFATPELSALARRGQEKGFGVGFAPMLPTLASETDLCSTIAGIDARRAAGRPIPEATTAVIEDLGLAVEDDDGSPIVDR